MTQESPVRMFYGITLNPEQSEQLWELETQAKSFGFDTLDAVPKGHVFATHYTILMAGIICFCGLQDYLGILQLRSADYRKLQLSRQGLHNSRWLLGVPAISMSEILAASDELQVDELSNCCRAIRARQAKWYTWTVAEESGTSA